MWWCGNKTPHSLNVLDWYCCYYEIGRRKYNSPEIKVSRQAFLWQSSALDTIKRGNVHGKTCPCHYLDSGQTASITILQQTFSTKSVFLFSNEETSASSRSTSELETGKFQTARERCQLLQHGCPSLYFFCSCPFSCSRDPCCSV